MRGRVVRVGERRDAYRVLVGKSEGKRPLGRPRRRWEILLEWIVKKYGSVMWIRLPYVRDKWRALVNRVRKFRVPEKCGEYVM